MPKSGISYGILTLVFWLGLLGAACSQSEGPVLKTQGKPIVYGSPDTNPAHMATVALTPGPDNGYFCSGSLITEDVVMTAAHCMFVMNNSQMQIFFGNDVRTGQGEYRRVADWLVNEGYNPDQLVNDIALLRLATPAPDTITPVPHLPAALGLSAADEGATTVDFSGFGVDENDESGLKLHVEDLIDVVCDNPQGCINFVVPNAFSYDQDPGGPCSGDSGGPAYILRDDVEYVAGVTSYGDENCAIRGVSTAADRFDAWINSFIIPEDCENGLDDDHDDMIDCADPECGPHPVCPDACELAETVGCGAVIEGHTEGGTFAFSQYACLPDGMERGPEKAYRLGVPAGTRVTADLFPAFGGDLDFFAITAADGECDPGACLGGSFEYLVAERIVFDVPAEATYLVVETWDAPTPYTLQITCGDAEDCLDGVDDDGDGDVDCDDSDCTLHPECQPNACDAGFAIACGETISADTNDGQPRFKDYSCLNQGEEIGPELAYRLHVPAGMQVRVDLAHPHGSDLDLLLLPVTGSTCDPDACIAASLEGSPPERLDFAMPAEGAFLMVETFQNANTFDLTVTCIDPEQCDNGLDDDGDALVDCADPDCADLPLCAEDCANELDDDMDGLVDCDDEECVNAAHCQTLFEDCFNGIDDDEDGAADCDDSDCENAPVCQPEPEICDNDADDDLDGKVDCDDTDCASDLACAPPPENCGNAIDDDEDGTIDCEDADCADHKVCQDDSKSGCAHAAGSDLHLGLLALFGLAWLGFLRRRRD